MSSPVLINYSGGVDSVYAAYTALRKGEKVYIHHCVLKSKTSRHDQEKRAVTRTLDYFKSHNLKNFKYIESGFDYGNLGYMIYDVELMGFITGTILRNPAHKEIKRVVVSVNSEDPTGKDINTPRRVSANALAEQVAGRKIKWEYPFIHMTKAEVMHDMPPKLLGMTWFCRRPQKNNTPCKSCASCKSTLPVVKSLTKYP
jgi:7-cyano-7-deazaguanine synthase in queuosine biosynthesis